jgi:hypothetical protein
MKKTIFILSAAATLIFVSCGLPAPKEQRIDLLNLSITVPSKKDIKAEAPSQYSMANADFYIEKKRFEIREIKEEKMPTDVNMLSEAIKADNDFKSLTEEKTFPNGAFGIVYENKKGKNFLFYFKKEGRCYKIIPVFNKEGENYNEAIESIGTLK